MGDAKTRLRKLHKHQKNKLGVEIRGDEEAYKYNSNGKAKETCGVQEACEVKRADGKRMGL